MKKLIAGICIVALVATGVAFAAGGPIAARKAKMKGVGSAMGVLVKMSKGQREFSTQASIKALRTMNSASKSMLGLFPPGTETGGKTTASKKIWSDSAGFKRAMNKFQADTAAAMANPPANKATLSTTIKTLGKNCKACHRKYRVKKPRTY